MKEIYIGFSYPTGNFEPFALLIQWVESRSYDHVYIRFPEPTGEYMIFQASKQMVNLYNTSIFNAHNKSVKEYSINCTDAEYDALWTFIKANLGIPYSLKEDFGILLMKIFKLTSNPFSEGMSTEFCSKLGAIVCSMFNIPIPGNPNTIDPSLLDSILSQAGIPVTLFNK
jgi:hypothetical protein